MNRYPIPILTFIPVLLGLVGATALSAREFAPGTDEIYEKEILPFFEQHCLECHDEATAKAGLNLETLSTDFLTAPSVEWVEVMDAINLGEMPPEDEPRPDAAKSFEVVKWIAEQLTYAEKTAREAGGRIPMRRLNRDEYANTVRDLLQIDEALLGPIVEELPGDGKAEGFDRLGVALFFDQTQVERTLGVAEQIAELAIVDPDEKPETKTTRYEAELERNKRRDGAISMGISHPEELERHRYDPEQRIPGGPRGYEITEDGVLFVKGGGYFARNDLRGRIAQIPVDDLIPEDGYYRVRLRGGGDMGTRGEPLTLSIIYNHKTPQEQNWDISLTPSLDQPDVVEATVFIPRGEADQTRRITLAYNHIHDYIVSTPMNNELYRDTVHTALKIPKVRAAGDEAEAVRLEAFLKEANARAKAWKGPLREINPKHAGIEPPRVFVDWVEFEGPVKGEWPPKSHQTLLFDGDERSDVAYAREIFERFLPRAYRRPAKPGEVDRVVDLIGVEMAAGKDFHAALRAGLARVLASPGFLFLSEPSAGGSRPLSDFELANRLSYFLWSTMPDAELSSLATAGKLSSPDILAAQVSRLLADPKSREFVENFAGQWLQVREFGSVMPATDLYRDYDNALEESSRMEAYAFFEEILQENLSITNFLDSDFVMINERLARHYEIEGVEGDELRRVSLTPEHRRGGVFGMAGLMTLLADGTRTLPVRRAAWIVENLFNDPPPPPPPNAGEVQPNTEGENLTVRERLELHRNEATCASCHAVLDPYGLALENYDAIGKWRTRQNGENFRGNNAPELVIEGELPTGQRFSSLEEFKAGLLEEKDDFARAFSERLFTYALGRPVGYSDRDTIKSFVNALQENDYQIQALVRAIVTSEPFLTK